MTAEGARDTVETAEGSSESAGIVATDAATAPKGAQPQDESRDREDASDSAVASEEEPLEGEALLEHNALALVFCDVRARSRNSELSTPERWAEAGLVPEHMTPEDLEMLVFDYLENWRAEHPSEAAADAAGSSTFFAEKAGRGAGPSRMRESDATEASLAASAPQKSPYASRCVGVPRLFAKTQEPVVGNSATNAVADAEEIGSAPAAVSATGAIGSAAGVVADQGAAQSAQGAVPLSDASHGAAAMSGAEEAAAGDAREGALPGDEGAQDDNNPFAGLDVPAGYELVQMEGEWVLVETGEEPEVKELKIDPRHICMLMGARGYYLYASDAMTNAFAHWAFLAAENDPAVTLADCAREESRVYPRPMPSETLKNPPFSMTDEQIEAAWEAVAANLDFSDVVRFAASNGDIYFYSTNYLSAASAEALAEWDAVERYMNV